MPTPGPDQATLRSAVALAVHAPSIHNTQPWRWRLDRHSLHLYADTTRWLPATDPGERDLLLSCGAALHHARIALAALGWSGPVHRLPNPDDPRHLAALELRPHDPTPHELEAATAIPLRRADRRRYADWPVPSGVLDELTARAAAEGVMLSVATDGWVRASLAEAIAEADRQQRSDASYTAELARWSGRSTFAEDGVLTKAASAGRRYGDVALRSFEGTPADAHGWGSGELMVLATASDDVTARVRAGEAASAVMLTAAASGLVSCPLSQPMEVDRTHAAVAELVGGLTPHLLIRVGWPPLNEPAVPHTPRRPVDDVIERPSDDIRRRRP